MKLENYFKGVERKHKKALNLEGGELIGKLNNLEQERSLYNMIKSFDFNIVDINPYRKHGDLFVDVYTDDYSVPNDVDIFFGKDNDKFGYRRPESFGLCKSFSYEYFNHERKRFDKKFGTIYLKDKEMKERGVDIIYSNFEWNGGNLKVDFEASESEIRGFLEKKGTSSRLVNEVLEEVYYRRLGEKVPKPWDDM